MKQDLTTEHAVGKTTRKYPNDNLRVVQIHPSLKCNLTCKHCYSDSGPSMNGHIDLDDISHFLQYASNYGFDVLSVSGGEPFLYPDLEELLSIGHSLEYKNIAASNGMLFKSDRSKRALKNLDLVAISIDGEEAFHDEIRNLKGAFNKMVEGIEVVKELGINFGFIHTVTEQSWQKLFWLSEFAFQKGASLLQLHPLELTGRALREFKHLPPSQESLHKVYILEDYLREKFAGKMKIHFDVLHRESILHSPKTISFHGGEFELNEANFSDVVKCLVIDQNGYIYPMSYGFHQNFCIGNINEIRRGNDVIREFIINKGKDLYSLISEVYSTVENEMEDDLIAWTAMIVRRSHAFNQNAATTNCNN